MSHVTEARREFVRSGHPSVESVPEVVMSAKRLAELPASSSIDPAFARVAGEDDFTRVRKALDALDPKQREFMQYRFGFVADSALDNEEIAHKTGRTVAEVYEIEKTAFARLRQFFAEE
ncbi:MAG: hypothetical protein JWL80_599 [Parcubacteria group bacterium]|nr:hypothetical protein [Parcubacteria group bacterium]